MLKNNFSNTSPHDEKKHTGETKGNKQNCSSISTIGNEVDENQSVRFYLETDQIIHLLKNTLKDYEKKEISFKEVNWYFKGVVDVVRHVSGPAYHVLYNNLKEIANAFFEVEKAESAALSQFDNSISNQLRENKKSR